MRFPAFLCALLIAACAVSAQPVPPYDIVVNVALGNMLFYNTSSNTEVASVPLATNQKAGTAVRWITPPAPG